MAWNEHEQEEAEMLQAYWTALEGNGTIEPPGGLDPEIAALARRLAHDARTLAPQPAFVAALQRQLLAPVPGARLNGHAPALARRPRLLHTLVLPWRPVLALTAAAMLVLGLAGAALATLLWTNQPKPVSAQTIVQRAITAAFTRSGASSFVMSEQAALWPAQGYRSFGFSAADVVRSTLTRWYRAPNHWRVQTSGTATPRSRQVGLSALAVPGVFVSDGSTVWDYCQPCHSVQIEPFAGQSGPGDLSPFGQDTSGRPAASLSSLLQQARACYTPRRLGDASVAGRPTYVIDLEPARCYSNSAHEDDGRRVIWVDKQTFFTLKSVLYSVYDRTRVFQTATVTRVQYNVALAPATFTYTPPLGVAVLDQRTPALTSPLNAGPYEPGLERLAARAGYPFFVPTEQLAGLALRRPRYSAAAGLQLIYAPPGASGLSGESDVVIVERRATQADAALTPGAQRVLVSVPDSTQTLGGWYQPGAGGRANRLSLVRNGVYVSLSSRLLARDALLALAGSLAALPREPSMPPNPPLQGLAALRARMPFPIFVPTYVPAGLAPRTPTLQGETVQIDYQAADGSVALSVLEGPAGCCLDADPRKGGKLVALPHGLSAHALPNEAQFGGPILWWEQDGAYLAISGPQLTAAQEVRVAASMSKTAPLGRIAPPAPPQPTPAPTANFTLLRPRYLPEPMDVSKQIQPGWQGAPATVMLTYTPRAGDWDRSFQGLTLSETPLTQGNNGSIPDPQATHTSIGGRDVTVVRRAIAGQGLACTMLLWTQHGLSLSLTNAYQPHNRLRYSCDQLKRVVASVQ